MVKGITAVAGIASRERFGELRELFAALGFEPGKGWSDAQGKGAAFLAPLGNIEFVTGRAPAVPALLVEVTQLDAAYAVVQSWSQKQKAVLSAPAATHWNSRLFTVELAPNLTLGFWESENPLHDKPIAIEGDLSAAGRSFAIVVARWNAVITDRLLQGALDALTAAAPRRRTSRSSAFPERGRFPRRRERWRKRDASRDHHARRVCSAARLPTTKRSTPRSRAASGSRSRRPEFPCVRRSDLRDAGTGAGSRRLKAGNKGFEAAIAAIEMASIQSKLAQPELAGAKL